MKNCPVLLMLIACFLSFSGCEEVTDLFPKKKKTTTDTVITEQTIGPEGGQLKTDSIEITFPAGTFTGNQTLKLAKIKDTITRFENRLSACYKIEGIEEEMRQAITIRILSDKKLESGQNGIIVFGNELLNETDDPNFSPMAAADSSDWLVVRLKLLHHERALDYEYVHANKTNKFIEARTDYTVFAIWNPKITTENFHIYYESSAGKDNIIALGNYLEAATRKFRDLGFTFDIKGAEVYVWNIPGGAYGMVHLGYSGRKIQINKDIASDHEMLKVTAGHEVFHWVQYEYDGSYFKWLKNLWVAEAFSTWSEMLFASSPATYYPDVIDGYECEPFQGIQKGATILPGEQGTALHEIASDHGYGMASFVKYLTRKYGNGLALKVYQELKAGTHPVYAFHRQINYQLASEWQHFLEELMLGKLFSKPQLPFHRHFSKLQWGNLSGELMIQTNDTTVTYEHPYADLSGRVYKVDVHVDMQNYNPQMQLMFKIKQKDHPSIENVSVFKVSGNDIVLLGSTQDSIVIGGLEDINKDNHHLYALVSCSNFSESPLAYTNNTDIHLTIETVKEPSGCQGGFFIDCIMQTNYSERTVYDTIQNFIIIFPYIESMSQTGNTINTRIGYADGVMVGNQYIASYERKIMLGASSNYNIHKGEIEIQFNDEKNTIIEMALIDSTQYHSDIGVNFYNTRIVCENIPYTGVQGEQMFFTVEGAQAASHIKSFQYSEAYPDGSTRSLIQYLAGSGNSIGITFKPPFKQE